MNASITVNTRCLTTPISGVQRYTGELLSRWKGNVRHIAPNRPMHGIVGHAWEQLILPLRIKHNFLFSPSNTGPLGTPNQVVVIHDTSVFDFPESFSSTFVSWYRFLLPKLAKRVKRIITDSTFAKERLLVHTGVDHDKISVVPCGVGPQFRPHALDEILAQSDRLNLPSRRYLLAVGSIEPRKNLRRLFAAWRLVQERMPEDVWLVVVGAQGNSRVFRDANLEDVPSRVFLAGYIPDCLLPAILAGAMAVVYPSLYEGFGLPALEAMASGTPVLTGNKTSLPEIVGDAGMMVDPTDVEGMAAGIELLVNDSNLRGHLREKGLVRCKQFTWEETSRRVWEIVRDAAEGSAHV